MNKPIYILIAALLTMLPAQKLTAQALDVVNSSNDTLMHVQDDGKVSIGGSTPSFSLDVAGKIGINDTQMLYLPDQINFTGSLMVGDGGTSLSHTTLREGYHNTAVGIGALNNITTGDANTASGFETLQYNVTGSLNTASGYVALNSNTSGNSNTGIGALANYANITGNSNTGIGASTNYFNQAGSNNTIIGYEAGRGTTLHDKSGNVFIGYQAGYNETDDNKLYIENSNSGTPLIGGDFAADEVYLNGRVGIGTSTPITQTKLHVTSNSIYSGYFTSDNLSFSTHVIHAEYDGSNGNIDVTAIYGRSEPNPSTGYGGIFVGGWHGVDGAATMNGTGSRYGVFGIGSNGNFNNYGVFGTATGGTTARGVYGIASGATTNYAVYASGNLAYTGALISISDIKVKENIRPVPGALTKVLQLNGRRYNFTTQSQYTSMNLAKGDQYGLIAQEVEQVLPELVVAATHPGDTDSDGRETGEPINYKGIKYMALIPLMIESIKEQQVMIEKQNTRIEKLEALVVKLRQ